MNRVEEFTQHYYDWIVKCLRLDNKLDVLAFFMLGCDIGVRQKELASITCNQVEFPYINNLKILKVRDGNQLGYYIPGYYHPLKFSGETATVIHTGCTDKSDKLFPKHVTWYVDQIRQSCGDSRFCGHDMRKIAAILKYNELIKG